MNRAFAILCVGFVSVSGVSASAQTAPNFYGGVLERGKVAYAAGQYESAAKYFEIAAFGFLESLPEYETAEIYLALSRHQSGNDDGARAAIEAVMRAEQVAPTYRTLALDPKIRNSFEAVIASVLPSQSINSVIPPTTVRKQPQSSIVREPVDQPAVAPAPAAPEVPVPPIPSPPKVEVPAGEPAGGESAGSAQPIRAADTNRETMPATTEGSKSAEHLESTVEIQDLEALHAKQPDSAAIALALADAHLRVGNIGPAEKLANDVLASDRDNPIAHTYLARIAYGRDDAAGAIHHYEAAQKNGTLSDDDEATLFVCYVTTGDYAAARAIEPALTESVKQRPPVAAALETLRKKPVAMTAPPAELPLAPAKPRVAETTGVPTAHTDRSPPGSAEASATSHNPPSREDIFVSVREARRYFAQGDCESAVAIYNRILSVPDLERFVVLAVGQGLGLCKEYRASLDAYNRVAPLTAGEEEHIFRVAVDEYELGDLPAARDSLKRAIGHIEQTGEVQRYRSLIEGTR